MKAHITLSLDEATRLVTEDINADLSALPSADFKGDVTVTIEVPKPPRLRANKIAAIKYLRDTINNGFACNKDITHSGLALVNPSNNPCHRVRQNIGLADAKRLVEELLTAGGVDY
jgi:ribosomal protein L7/L12